MKIKIIFVLILAANSISWCSEQKQKEEKLLEERQYNKEATLSLLRATREADLEQVNNALVRRADVNAEGYGETPLFLAIKGNRDQSLLKAEEEVRTKIVERLLQEPAIEVNKGHPPAIIGAMDNNYHKSIEFLLRCPSLDVDTCEEGSMPYSLLAIAMSRVRRDKDKRYEPIVKALLLRDARYMVGRDQYDPFEFKDEKEPLKSILDDVNHYKEQCKIFIGTALKQDFPEKAIALIQEFYKSSMSMKYFKYLYREMHKKIREGNYHPMYSRDLRQVENEADEFGYNPWLLGVYYNNTDVVTELFNKKNESRLHSGHNGHDIAYARGHTRLAHYLKNYDAASHALCEAKTKEEVNAALEQGAQCNWENIDGKTPLRFACDFGRTEVVARLLEIPEVCAKSNEVDTYGRTPLIIASWWYYPAIVSHLLEYPKVREGINFIDQFGYSALSKICNSYKLDRSGYSVIEKMLYCGADSNVSIERWGSFLDIVKEHVGIQQFYIPFFIATTFALPKEIAQIIGKYYQRSLFSADDRWRIDLAIEDNNLARLQELVPRQNVECIDERGNTPLLQAVKRGSATLVSWLLSQGADPEAQTNDMRYYRSDTSFNAMELAEQKGHTEIVKLLTAEKERRAQKKQKLLQSCTIEEISDQAKTEKEIKVAQEDLSKKGLGQVAEERNALMAQLESHIKSNDHGYAVALVRDNNLLHVRDSKGWTPLKLALYYGQKAMALELIAMGAYLKREEADSPHMYAIYLDWIKPCGVARKAAV